MNYHSDNSLDFCNAHALYHTKVMHNDLVSVIIPAYNRAYCLSRAVDSALKQTYSPVEVLVIDDGSTDSTGKLISDLYGNDPRVRYFFQENLGVSSARNKGLSEARGEYIAFLDSDDLWKEWKVELQVACLKKHPEVGMVWTEMEAVDADDVVISPKYLKTMYRAYKWFKDPQQLFERKYSVRNELSQLTRDFSGDVNYYIGDIFGPMILGNLVHTSTVLLRRERAQKAIGFREDIIRGGEDYVFHLQTCRNGPVAFIDIASIGYKIGMPDALTVPANNAYIAMVFLNTVNDVLTKERSIVRIPDRLVLESMAENHAWAAREYLAAGDVVKSRYLFLKSLRYKWWQPKEYRFMLVSMLPAFIIKSLAKFKRQFR